MEGVFDKQLKDYKGLMDDKGDSDEDNHQGVQEFKIGGEIVEEDNFSDDAEKFLDRQTLKANKNKSPAIEAIKESQKSAKKDDSKSPSKPVDSPKKETPKKETPKNETPKVAPQEFKIGQEEPSDEYGGFSDDMESQEETKKPVVKKTDEKTPVKKPSPVKETPGK